MRATMVGKQVSFVCSVLFWLYSRKLSLVYVYKLMKVFFNEKVSSNAEEHHGLEI